MTRKFRLPMLPDGLMLALALGALAINVLLFYRVHVGGGLAGCGSGSGCGELLVSRWSRVLGIPVSGFGVLVYLGVLVSFTPMGRRLLDPCLGLIVGAAVWFTVVQAVIVGRFCPWCMTAHGIGLSLAALAIWRAARAGTFRTSTRTLGLVASYTMPVLAAVQAYGPKPATYRIDDAGGVRTSQAAAVHARGTGRKVAFDGGRKTYDVVTLPHLGPADARRVMVEYFDYSCAACQTMSGFLQALMARHPADLCLVVLPVPLAGGCNHALGEADAQHPESCELSRLALAVWRTMPQAFPGFHQKLLDGASVGTARAAAVKLLSRVRLDEALDDPWINEVIAADVDDWVAYSRGTRTLPKLLITDRRVLHGLPSGEADFIRVIERELGL